MDAETQAKEERLRVFSRRCRRPSGSNVAAAAAGEDGYKAFAPAEARQAPVVSERYQVRITYTSRQVLLACFFSLACSCLVTYLHRWKLEPKIKSEHFTPPPPLLPIPGALSTHCMCPNHRSIYPLGRQQYAGQGTDGGARHIIKLHRPIMSRRCGDTLRVLETLDPPDVDVNRVGGCCGLCRLVVSIIVRPSLSSILTLYTAV